MNIGYTDGSVFVSAANKYENIDSWLNKTFKKEQEKTLKKESDNNASKT